MHIFFFILCHEWGTIEYMKWQNVRFTMYNSDCNIVFAYSSEFQITFSFTFPKNHWRLWRTIISTFSNGLIESFSSHFLLSASTLICVTFNRTSSNVSVKSDQPSFKIIIHYKCTLSLLYCAAHVPLFIHS